MKIKSVSVKIILNTEEGSVDLHNAVVGLGEGVDNRKLNFLYEIRDEKKINHSMHIQPIDIIPSWQLRVKVVNHSKHKDPKWTNDARGKIFKVLRKRENGYDIDLTPLGTPEDWGFVRHEEVVETDEPVTEFDEKNFMLMDCKI